MTSIKVGNSETKTVGKEGRIKGVIQNRGFRYDRGREGREGESREGKGRGLGGGGEERKFVILSCELKNEFLGREGGNGKER